MSKRPLHAKIIDFFGNIYKTLRFLFHHLQEKRRFGNYYYSYRPLHKGETANILANGPSLNAELEGLMTENSTIENSLVVNFFVESEMFIRVKPKYYCLADPGFNIKECLTERTRNTYALLNELVSWPMTIFVWKEAEIMVTEFIDNSFITIIGLSILRYEGFDSKRYEYFKNGIAVPAYVNVTIMALYALLNIGYSTIYLYGVDHTFLTGIYVNEKNRLCVIEKHFYGTIMSDELPPRSNGILWHVKDFVYDKYLTFAEHEVMRGYADYLGAQIINCTKDSWIDAYVRKAQLEK